MEHLLEMKFEESVTHPVVFQHETRDILLCVHADDLLCTGLRDGLMWLKKQLLGMYELETLSMGDDDDMAKKAVYLGRTLGWGENGLSVRPDRRHMRSLFRELGMENCRSISTPLCATCCTGLCTWPKDRLDLGVAAVELAKTKAIPREGDDERFKRVARTLHGHPDYLQWYSFQEDTDTEVLTTDADWAT